MNKKIWWIAIVVIVAGVAVFLFVGNHNKTNTSTVVALDPLNATYLINNAPVALVDGQAQSPAAPGSAEQIITKIFGQQATGDLNGDGRSDAALIITQDSGGSGTFFYVVAALNTASGTMGTNAILLGDRITPEDIIIKNGQIVVTYADRNPGEPMSATPSVEVIKYFSVKNLTLEEGSSTAENDEQ